MGTIKKLLTAQFKWDYGKSLNYLWDDNIQNPDLRDLFCAVLYLYIKKRKKKKYTVYMEKLLGTTS